MAYPIKIKQGSTFSLSLTWKDSSDVAISLTGYTARMKIKTAVGGETIVSLTDVSGITLGGAAGTVVVTIAATATALYTFKRGRYDLEVVSGGGVVTTLLDGPVTLIPEVTV